MRLILFYRNLKQSIKLGALGLIALIAVILIIYLIVANITTGEKKIEKSNVVVPNAQVEQGPSGSPLLLYENAAISTDNQVCSDVGKSMFDKGGNVVDAALAALFCNGLLTMQSMGIGGGMIMNVYIKKDNKAYTIDGMYN